MRKLLRIVAPLVLVLAACEQDPIEWGEISYRPSRLGDPDTRSAIMSASLPAIPGTVGSCLRSIRAAGDSSDLFRVWWSSRADSSVVLSMQRSTDQGRTWLAPLVADSTDRGRRGCDRPAPATVFEPVSGYLYLVYFIESRFGAGVFFAHSMDRGDMLHAPVPVIYGKRPSAAHVAGRGDSVVVVFEDPNASQSLVGYALSRTNGHIFEQRGRVTPNEEVATAPWSALEGDSVTVWWKSGDRGSRISEDADRVGFRSGVWK
ncbi:MAG TPA: sialidase family protein [Gemmatimonadaceae bacterium]|nr:sialidase family protein [Gemmatimonadaceae bacterium]